MRPVDLIGWAASAVLVVTLARQVHVQWKAGTSAGVSSGLFLGQIAASVGFLAYSAALGSDVFVVTNALLIVDALVGYALLRRHRRRSSA